MSKPENNGGIPMVAMLLLFFLIAWLAEMAGWI